MLFALICQDRPGALELRLATRPAHLAYLTTYVAKVVQGAAMLDGDGRPCGSILMIEVADRAEAEGFAMSDPFAKVGLYESTVIRPMRMVLRDGEFVG